MKNGQATSIHNEGHKVGHTAGHTAGYNDRQNIQSNARAQSQYDGASRLTTRANESEYEPVQPLLKYKVTVDSAAPTVVLSDVLAGGSPAQCPGSNPTLMALTVIDSFVGGDGANAEHDHLLAFGELFSPDGMLTSRMLLAGALTN